MSTVEEYLALRLKYLDLRNSLNLVAQESFNGLVRSLFDTHETLESFGWTQYTPKPTDDDLPVPALIGAVTINGKADDGSEFMDAVDDLLSLFDDEVFLLMYGKNVTVEIGRDSIARIRRYKAPVVESVIVTKPLKVPESVSSIS